MVKLIESFFQAKNLFGEYAVPGRIIFCAPSGALYVTMRLYNKQFPRMPLFKYMKALIFSLDFL